MKKLACIKTSIISHAAPNYIISWHCFILRYNKHLKSVMPDTYSMANEDTEYQDKQS